MSLILPWPPSKLNPNQRTHFRAKAKIASKYKSDCYFLTKAATLNRGGIIPDGKVHLYIMFHAPDNRKRDMDNLLSSMKAGLDGIALALGVNDSGFRPVTIDFGPNVKGGAVRVWFDGKKNV